MESPRAGSYYARVSLGVHLFSLADMKRNDPEGEAFLRGAFARLNEALARRGLPLHHEPEEPVALSLSGILANMPYATFDALGRALIAHRSPKVADRFTYAESVVIGLESHLVCHANNAGFYLPIDFERPLHATFDEAHLPGGLVGSSQRLLAELLEIAPALKVDPESPEPLEGGRNLALGWHTLRAMAQASTDHRTAIWLQ